MGRRRKSNRKGQTESSEIRRQEAAEEALARRNALRAMKEALAKANKDFVEKLDNDIFQMYSSEERIPTEEQKPRRVPTEDLETILGALHDGVRPGPGEGDLELLADIVCELIERRKAEAGRSGWKNLKGTGCWGGGDNGGWRSDFRTDSETLYAPDGTKLITLSGLMLKSIGRYAPGLKREIEEKEMAKWRQRKSLEGWYGGYDKEVGQT